MTCAPSFARRGDARVGAMRGGARPAGSWTRAQREVRGRGTACAEWREWARGAARRRMRMPPPRAASHLPCASLRGDGARWTRFWQGAPAPVRRRPSKHDAAATGATAIMLRSTAPPRSPTLGPQSARNKREPIACAPAPDARGPTIPEHKHPAIASNSAPAHRLPKRSCRSRWGLCPKIGLRSRPLATTTLRAHAQAAQAARPIPAPHHRRGLGPRPTPSAKTPCAAMAAREAAPRITARRHRADGVDLKSNRVAARHGR
jgi:hypothetical protein